MNSSNLDILPDSRKNTLTFLAFIPQCTHPPPRSLSRTYTHVHKHDSGPRSHLARFHYARLSGRHASPPPHARCHLYMIFWVIITAIRPSSLSLFHFLFIGRHAASLCSSLFSALCSAGPLQ